MKTVAIIQARMNSSRLPGKILEDIAGKPLLHRVIERAQAAGVFDEVILATSQEESDDPVAAYCRNHGISYYRGNLNDVLDRYCQAALQAKADIVTRLTGDCPLLDPEVIRAAVTMFRNGNFDYVSNAIERTYPDGLDTEVFSFAALETAQNEARLPSEREHVTPFIHKHPDRFRLGHLTQEKDLSALRWTVDEQCDLDLVRAIYDRLGNG